MFKKASEREPKEVYRDDEIVGYIMPPDLSKGKIDDVRFYHKASEYVKRCKGCGIPIDIDREHIYYCKDCFKL